MRRHRRPARAAGPACIGVEHRARLAKAGASQSSLALCRGCPRRDRRRRRPPDRLADRLQPADRRIHFACATPPQPAIATLSGRFAARSGSGRRRRRRRGRRPHRRTCGRSRSGVRGSSRRRAPRRNTRCANARSVSAARMAPPLIRKNCASPICRPERPLLSTARNEHADRRVAQPALPPRNDAPPMITATMASSSRPKPAVGAAAPSRPSITIMPTAVKQPMMTSTDEARAAARRRPPGAACADRRRAHRCAMPIGRRAEDQPAGEEGAARRAATAGVKPNRIGVFIKSTKPWSKAMRRGAGQRDGEPARPDPGGERDDQRVEAEPADDQAVQARRRARQAAMPATSASGTGTPCLCGKRRHDGAERERPSPARCRPSARRCRSSRRPRRSRAPRSARSARRSSASVAKRGLITAKTMASSKRRRRRSRCGRAARRRGHAAILVGERLADAPTSLSLRAGAAARRPSRQAGAGR